MFVCECVCVVGGEVSEKGLVYTSFPLAVSSMKKTVSCCLGLCAPSPEIQHGYF